MPSTLDFLEKLQEVPSSPFAPTPPKEYIQNVLEEYKIPYEINDYYIIAKPNNKKGTKLVLLSHLDHPAMIFKDHTTGLLLGSVGHDRLKKILENNSIPIRIYDEVGTYLGKGKITSLNLDPKYFSFQSNIKIKRNYTAQYDFAYYKDTGEHIDVYNADNAVDTAAMLSLLSKKIKSNFDL